MLKSDFRREDKASVSFCPGLLSPHTHCLHTSTLNGQRKENSQKLLAPRAWRHLVQKTTNPWPMIFPLISSYLQAAHREGQRFPKTRALIIKSNRPDLNRELLAMRLPQQPSTARYAAYVFRKQPGLEWVPPIPWIQSTCIFPRHRADKRAWWKPEHATF